MWAVVGTWELAVVWVLTVEGVVGVGPACTSGSGVLGRVGVGGCAFARMSWRNVAVSGVMLKPWVCAKWSTLVMAGLAMGVVW